jgi:hypothetical protein
MAMPVREFRQHLADEWREQLVDKQVSDDEEWK